MGNYYLPRAACEAGQGAGEHGGETGNAPTGDEGGFGSSGTGPQPDADGQKSNKSRSKKCFRLRRVRHKRRRHSGALSDGADDQSGRPRSGQHHFHVIPIFA
jgi:hypothetical protein